MKRITLSDSGMSYPESYNYFDAADDWASKYCTSYVKYEITDVSDVSGMCDTIAEYVFEDDKDSTLFLLKWKQ